MHNFQFYFVVSARTMFYCFATTEGWWVGRAEKWRSPFLGVGLAMRCERSEHGKSQLSIKYLRSILLLVFKVIVISSFIFSGFAIIVSNALSFSLPNRTALSATCAQRSGSLARWRLSLPLGRATHLQSQTKFRTRQGRHLAKLLVTCWASFYYFSISIFIVSNLLFSASYSLNFASAA